MFHVIDFSSVFENLRKKRKKNFAFIFTWMDVSEKKIFPKKDLLCKSIDWFLNEGNIST